MNNSRTIKKKTKKQKQDNLLKLQINNILKY